MLLAGLCGLLIIVTSYLIGGLFIKEEQGVAAMTLGGFLTELAIFLIITLPCIGLHTSAGTYANLVISVILTLSVLSVIRAKAGLYQPVCRWLSSVVDGVRNFAAGRDRLQICLIAFAVAIILLQTGAAVLGVHYDDDDAFYVATATTAGDTDTIYGFNPYTGAEYHHLPARYVLAPWSMYGVVWSHFTTVRPAVFYHTVLPMLLIPLSYIAMYLLACRIWDAKTDKKKIYGFLIAIAFLQMFAGFSTWSVGARLMYRVWQGKTVLASVILPTIFTFILYEWDKEKLSARIGFYLFITMTAACFVSSMGVILPLVELFALGVTKLIIKRTPGYVLQLIPCAASNIIIGVIYTLIR